MGHGHEWAIHGGGNGDVMGNAWGECMDTLFVGGGSWKKQHHGSCMGRPWGMHWESMINSCDVHGEFMGIHGKFMGVMGNA